MYSNNDRLNGAPAKRGHNKQLYCHKAVNREREENWRRKDEKKKLSKQKVRKLTGNSFPFFFSFFEI